MTNKLSRRDFLKRSGLLGAALATGAAWFTSTREVEAMPEVEEEEMVPGTEENPYFVDIIGDCFTSRTVWARGSDAQLIFSHDGGLNWYEL